MFLLFDVGGTKIRFALSSDKKSIQDVKILPVPKKYHEALELFQSIGESYVGAEKFQAVVGGIAGPLDSKKSMLVASPNLPDWVNKPLKQDLEQLFKTRVSLENDAALGGLGEAIYGAGKGKRIVVYITISTGVGGTRIVNGEFDESALGFEPGHMILDPDGPLCNCGGRGDWESLVSGTAMHRKHGNTAADLTDSEIWDEEARLIALGLHNISVLWSPDIIVLGGSVMQKVSIQKVQKDLGEIMKIFPNPPEVVKWELGEETSLYGALARALQLLI